MVGDEGEPVGVAGPVAPVEMGLVPVVVVIAFVVLVTVVSSVVGGRAG